MRDNRQFFIDGQWVDPLDGQSLDVVNPANGEVSGAIGSGSAADLDRAVAAAKAAFPTYSVTPIADRVVLLDRIITEYTARQADMGAAIRLEMGAPSWLADGFHTLLGLVHFQQTREALAAMQLEQPHGTSLLTYEAIGVCGLITPWNWPMNQVACKVAPALAAGCTIVLKPSEIAPYSSYVFAEILEAAGVPAGVFNMVNGTGAVVGAALSSHPDVDLVSFTGSTRAGIEIARNAAPTVKRVLQELGGKSANILLSDVDVPTAVERGVDAVMVNSGQTCNAPTRMLVPRNLLQAAVEVAKRTADNWTVGNPEGNARMGPVANGTQWNKVQALIQAGLDEGATLIAGGTGRPSDLSSGFYVRPTIFSDVTPDMRLAKEEIFGPVLVMMPYESEEEAIRIANASEYGLAGYVSGEDQGHCRSVARRLRAGQIFINHAENDFAMPFGGYKQSGNGREWGKHGLLEFFEVKAIIGYERAS